MHAELIDMHIENICGRFSSFGSVPGRPWNTILHKSRNTFCIVLSLPEH